MKHQVFFMLSLYCFSMYSMNYNVSEITQDQIISDLTRYNDLMREHFSHCFPVEGLKQDIENIRKKDLSDNDKKEILAVISTFPLPLKYGEKYLLVEPLHEAIK